MTLNRAPSSGRRRKQPPEVVNLAQRGGCAATDQVDQVADVVDPPLAGGERERASAGIGALYGSQSPRLFPARLQRDPARRGPRLGGGPPCIAELSGAPRRIDRGSSRRTRPRAPEERTTADASATVHALTGTLLTDAGRRPADLRPADATSPGPEEDQRARSADGSPQRLRTQLPVTPPRWRATTSSTQCGLRAVGGGAPGRVAGGVAAAARTGNCATRP